MRFHRLIYLFGFLLLALFLYNCSSLNPGKSGAHAYDYGEYDDAAKKLQKAAKKEKDPAKKREYEYLSAKALYKLGRYQQAESKYRSLVRKGNSEKSIPLDLANILRSNEKYEEAIIYYQLYLDSVPDDKQAINGIESCKIIQEWAEHPTRFQVNAETAINSRYADFSPAFAGSLGNKIIFTSSREGATGKKKSGITGQYFTDLYVTDFDVQKQKWSKPVRIDEESIINTADEEGAPSITSNGTMMYFTRCPYRKKGSAYAQIYTARHSQGVWSDPTIVALGPDSIPAAHPSISSDGFTLYFVSDMDGGYGGLDIWKVEQFDGAFTEPVNLGPDLNTPGNEMFPFIRDNGELYFSSDYHVGIGGLDIFKATPVKSEDKKIHWNIENMQAPINSPGDDFGIAFVEGKDEGFFSSNRKGSRGDDLYSFALPPKIYKAEGEIVDANTGTRVKNAYIRIIGTDGTMLKIRSDDGKFQYKLNPETEYIFAAFKDGFLNAKTLINTIGYEDSKDFKLELSLTPTDAPINVSNINYEFGKWDLLTSSQSALDSLVNLLNQNPTIVIELMAHTDFVGSAAYNSELSQKRAQSVVNYLASKGINQRRLVAKGYGETWPKVITKSLAMSYDFLKQGDELTEEFINNLATDEQKETAKALCRRTEFRVLRNDFREIY